MDIDPRIGIGVIALLGLFLCYQSYRDFSAQSETTKSGAWRIELIVGLFLLGAGAYVAFQDYLGPETIPWFYHFLESFDEIR